MNIKDRLRDMQSKKYNHTWSHWVQKQCAEAADHIEAQEWRIAELEGKFAPLATSSVNAIKLPSIATIIQDGTSTMVWYFLSGDETKYETTIRDLIRAKLQIDATQPAPANAIDAERYRFIRKSGRFNSDSIRIEWYLPRNYSGNTIGDRLDSSIDAAMKAAK